MTFLDQLRTYAPSDEAEAAHRARMVALLTSAPDPFSRAHFAPGHFTASCYIVDDSGRLLLHHHRRLNRWLQMGGHVEPGESTACAALREGAEESGLPDLELVDPRHVARSEPVMLSREDGEASPDAMSSHSEILRCASNGTVILSREDDEGSQSGKSLPFGDPSPSARLRMTFIPDHQRRLRRDPAQDDGGIFDLDIHGIPAAKGEPTHDHFDVRYLARTGSPDAVAIDRAESNELAWVTLGEAAERMPAPESQRVLRKIERLLSERSVR